MKVMVTLGGRVKQRVQRLLLQVRSDGDETPAPPKHDGLTVGKTDRAPSQTPCT